MAAEIDRADECPSEEVLVGFVARTLAGHGRGLVELHIDRCGDCRTLLAALAGAETASSAGRSSAADQLPTEVHGGARADGALPRGAIVGRFVILDQVGAGGMGVVYAAYDPELDRKVAIKLLRPGVGGEGGDARLHREAQAMARVAHEHVVTVFEVGGHRGQVFVAMELVEGPTLRDWLASGPWPSRQVVGRFVQAGRGLAAAHASGLVHRDFKPHNVLGDAAGRMRVSDFGLAVSGSEPAAVSSGELPEAPPAALTQTGALVGTPAYMAPEQLAGGPVDARSDQFSFCVALWEGLFGERPFAGDLPAEILDAIEHGRIRPPTARVPAGLMRLLRRGLARDPVARHPSMAALVDDLARLHDRPRRRTAVALAAVAIACAIGAALVASIAREEAAVCARPTDRFTGVWQSDRRDALVRRFADSGVPGARDAAARITRVFDAHRERWLDQHVDACRQSRLGAQSEALLDLRVDCLEDRRRDFQALVDVLVGADRTVVEHAVRSTIEPRELDGCADVHALREVVPRPRDAATAAKVAVARQVVAEVRAHTAAGEYPAGLELASVAIARARASGFTPLVAETLFERGRLHGLLEHHAEATRDLDDAVVAGLAGRHHAQSAKAWIALSQEYITRDPEEGLRLLRHAEALIDAMGHEEQLGAELHCARGRFHLLDGSSHDAAAEYEACRAIYARLRGVDDATTITSAMNVALATALHAPAEGARLARAALDAFTAALGPEHPSTIKAYQQLGLILLDNHADVEARDAFERHIAAASRTLGVDSLAVAHSLTSLGTLRARLDDPAGALEAVGRALEIYRAKAPGHVQVAVALDQMAEVYLDLGDPARALALGEESIALQRAQRGDDSVDLQGTLVTTGAALGDLGRHDEAIARQRAALAAIERLDGKDSLALIDALDQLAASLERVGRHREALPLRTRSGQVIARGIGAASAEMATQWNQVGQHHLERGDGAAALAAFERAAAIEAGLPRDDHRAGDTQGGLGRARLALGDATGAHVALERADGLLAAAPDLARAEVGFALAKALWDGAGDRVRARTLASQARAAIAAVAVPDRDHLRELDRWLASHRR